jgi:hypothetical protein
MVETVHRRFSKGLHESIHLLNNYFPGTCYMVDIIPGTGNDTGRKTRYLPVFTKKIFKWGWNQKSNEGKHKCEVWHPVHLMMNAQTGPGCGFSN